MAMKLFHSHKGFTEILNLSLKFIRSIAYLLTLISMTTKASSIIYINSAIEVYILYQNNYNNTNCTKINLSRKSLFNFHIFFCG